MQSKKRSWKKMFLWLRTTNHNKTVLEFRCLARLVGNLTCRNKKVFYQIFTYGTTLISCKRSLVNRWSSLAKSILCAQMRLIEVRNRWVILSERQLSPLSKIGITIEYFDHGTLYKSSSWRLSNANKTLQSEWKHEEQSWILMFSGLIDAPVCAA